MTGDELTPPQIAAITAAVDIGAVPPPGRPAALVLFGTNQLEGPVRIAAERYRRGLAPLIIATAASTVPLRATAPLPGRVVAPAGRDRCWSLSPVHGIRSDGWPPVMPARSGWACRG